MSAVRVGMAVLAALLLSILGCRGVARDPVLLLAEWTFVPPAGPPRPVTLPTHLELPEHATRYTLRTTAALPPDMTGRALTLAFVRLPAIAELRVNGQEAISLDADVTTRYRVSGAQR